MANGLLNNIISYWTCDGVSGALGDIVNGYTLTGVVDSPTRTTGKNNNGAQMNSDNVVSESGEAALNFRQNPMVSFTISMWVNPNAVKTSGSTWLWEQYDGVGEEGWGLVLRGQSDPDDFNFFMKHAAGTFSCINAFGNVSVGTFYHVVARYDADTAEMALFINGNKATADASGLQVITAGAAKFTLGGWAASGTENSNAVIDEIAAWSVALTDTQVGQLYNLGTGLFYASFDASTGSGETDANTPGISLSDQAPVFCRHFEVRNHLQANPLDTGDAAITVLYRQVPV